jgi:hypothetical protein
MSSFITQKVCKNDLVTNYYKLNCLLSYKLGNKLSEIICD